jgi:cytochrome c oxidase assembly factor CtaG
MTAVRSQDLAGGWDLLAGPVPAAVALAALYVAGVRSTRRGWPVWRSACFATGLLAVTWALASGLDVWSQRLLSVHMVQHLVLAFVAAPLLVAGAPERLALLALRGRARRRLGRMLHMRTLRALSHPVTGCASFAAVILVTHLTGFYAAALRKPLVHEAEHVAILGSAILLFASMARAPAITRLVTLTVATVPMGIVGAWLGWATSVRYPPYAGPGALDDQGLSAAIMWACAAIPVALGSVALAGVALWREEQRQRRRETIASRRRQAGAAAP